MNVRSRPRINRIKKNWIAYLFILPSFCLFLVFMVIPLASTIFISLTSWNMLESPTVIGIQNYRELLGSRIFWETMLRTVLYVGMYIPPVLGISFVVAVLLNNRKIRGKSLFRGVFFIPVILSMIVTGVAWTWIYHQQLGVLNYVLSVVGMKPRTWIGDRALALPSVTVTVIWKNMGYFMVFYLAGLQTIPAFLYEVAEMDGASSIQKLLYITVPLMRPTLLLVLVLATIWSFQIFDPIFVMTYGGPSRATTTIVWYIYEVAFKNFRMGYASCIGVALLLIVLVLSLIELFFLRKRVEY